MRKLVIESLAGLVDRMVSEYVSDQVRIIGVAGFSGSGKTTLCRRIVESLQGRAHHLDCDRFSAYSYSERQSRLDCAARSGDPAVMSAEENPRHWYAWDALADAVSSLRDSRMFAYDRAWNKNTGMLDGNYAIALPSEGPALVLCDCIYLLHPPVRQWFDTTVYVDVPFSLTVDRGLLRAPNSQRAAYMERLHRTYSLPYFEEHARNADWVYDDRP
ncbi:hypothetical protein [Agrobacterium vitis]|uniref:Phosphoribulokinase/uridine kinase domain-containing protein n=1 Tax=Agrobacterium vitis TaxID=373 RepID=A0ABW9TEN8_AGRVI|nr:hypothetical protein [Agrobacterium vitis]MUO43013.1 hypothetical protein [Agrobacterium vitis]